jgi:hypothetical protein
LTRGSREASVGKQIRGTRPLSPQRSDGGEMTRVFKLPVLQPALAWFVGSYLKVALRTTRWHVHGGDPSRSVCRGKGRHCCFLARTALLDADAVGEGAGHATHEGSQHPHAGQSASRREADWVGVAAVWGSGHPRFIQRWCCDRHAEGNGVAEGGPAGCDHARRTTRAAARRSVWSGADRCTHWRAGASLLGSDLSASRSAELGSDGPAAAVRSRRPGMRAAYSRATAGLGGITSNDRDCADCGRRAR